VLMARINCNCVWCRYHFVFQLKSDGELLMLLAKKLFLTSELVEVRIPLSLVDASLPEHGRCRGRGVG
jgi:hypothetical protein